MAAAVRQLRRETNHDRVPDKPSSPCGGVAVTKICDLVATRPSWYGKSVMLHATRFATSLAISLWGLAMLLIGIVNAVSLWIVLGVVVMGVGLPFLASHPWAADRLYPTRGGIDPSLSSGTR